MDYMELRKVFADRIRTLMADNGLDSIQAFAGKVGIPRVTVSNWINLTRSPQIEFIYMIAKCFDVSTDFLFGLED